MKKIHFQRKVRFLITSAILLVLSIISMACQSPPAENTEDTAIKQVTSQDPEPVSTSTSEVDLVKENVSTLPKLLDLGSVGCRACTMMEPILDELRMELDGKLTVEFIDIRVNRGVGNDYGIRAIPTQIFLDPSGIEIFRHIGFYSKEEILAKWGELGYNFQPAQ